MRYFQLVLTILPLLCLLSLGERDLISYLTGQETPSPVPCLPYITNKGAPINVTISRVLSNVKVLPCTKDISDALKAMFRLDAEDTRRKATVDGVEGLCSAFVNLTSIVILTGYKKSPNLRDAICEKSILTKENVEDRDFCNFLDTKQHSLTTTYVLLNKYPAVAKAFVSLTDGDCARKCDKDSKRVLCNAFFSLAELLSTSYVIENKSEPAVAGPNTSSSKSSSPQTQKNTPMTSRDDGGSNNQEDLLANDSNGDGSSVNIGNMPEKKKGSTDVKSDSVDPSSNRSEIIRHLATPILLLPQETLLKLVLLSPAGLKYELDQVKELPADLKTELSKLEDCSEIVRMFWIWKIGQEKLRTLSDKDWMVILKNPTDIFPMTVLLKEKMKNEVRSFNNLDKVVKYIFRYRNILFSEIPTVSTVDKVLPNSAVDSGESRDGDKDKNMDAFFPDPKGAGGDAAGKDNSAGKINIPPLPSADGNSGNQNNRNSGNQNNGNSGNQNNGNSGNQNNGNSGNQNNGNSGNQNNGNSGNQNNGNNGDQNDGNSGNQNNGNNGDQNDGKVGSANKSNNVSSSGSSQKPGPPEASDNSKKVDHLPKPKNMDEHGDDIDDDYSLKNFQDFQVPFDDDPANHENRPEDKEGKQTSLKETKAPPKLEAKPSHNDDDTEEDRPKRSYGAFHFLTLFLIVGGVVVVTYVCMHNRKKLREGFGSYMSGKSRRRRVRDYKPLATSET